MLTINNAHVDILILVNIHTDIQGISFVMSWQNMAKDIQHIPELMNVHILRWQQNTKKNKSSETNTKRVNSESGHKLFSILDILQQNQKIKRNSFADSKCWITAFRELMYVLKAAVEIKLGYSHDM